jgi:hypothetical protein
MEHVGCETVGGNILSTRTFGTRTRILVVVVLAMAIVAPGLWAQTTAAIQGTVADAFDAPLAGVQVSVTGVQGVTTVVTDDKGFYQVPNLPPGTTS